MPRIMLRCLITLVLSCKILFAVLSCKIGYHYYLFRPSRQQLLIIDGKNFARAICLQNGITSL